MLIIKDNADKYLKDGVDVNVVINIVLVIAHIKGGIDYVLHRQGKTNL